MDRNRQSCSLALKYCREVCNYSQSFMPIFPQDFDTNKTLKYNVICFLEEVMHDPDLLTQERKAAANIIR